VIHAQALGYEGKTPDGGADQEQQVGFQEPCVHLLVSEPVQAAAIRALPGDAVAGHTPYILIHAFLANHEATAAAPAKGSRFRAAMADFRALMPSTGSAERLSCGIIHHLSQKG
jgi:hypothetical protein